ncbi:hypothetical protein KJ590_02620 [Patescibacteria group bacterium]|nr:hypothetical protein [Patescibacteria group bacterium]MBU4142871.1 hypothetical protein [Patescibacteria group bacterium]
MKRKPVSKNCRFCGRFMQIYWVEEYAEPYNEAKNIKENNEPLVPVFFCTGCGEWDNELIVRCYDYLLYEGSVDFDDPLMDLREFVELLAEDCVMRELFMNRPYLAIPG